MLASRLRRTSIWWSGTEFNLGPTSTTSGCPISESIGAILDEVWLSTAAMVVEVVSPHDESWLKFDHYAAHGVDEVLIADPQDSTLHLFVLDCRHLPAGRRQPAARGHGR